MERVSKGQLRNGKTGRIISKLSQA